MIGAGTLAYLMNQNGDFMGAIFPTEQSLKYFPFKTGLMNIENILEQYDKSVTMTNLSTINTALDYIVRNFRRNMIIVIVTDIHGIHEIPETTLKRLKVMNDVLMINVKDAAIFSSSHSQASHIKTSQKRISQVYSIEKEGYLSEFFTKDKKLAKLQEEKQQNMYKECVDKLKRYGIPFTTINHTQEIDQTLIKFL